MTVGPQRVAQVAKKEPVKKPVSVTHQHTGIVGDERPTGTSSHLERARWGIKNRADQGDWTP